MSYKVFCLRTSKGLSVGEFDNTEFTLFIWLELHMFIRFLLSFSCVMLVFCFVFRYFVHPEPLLKKWRKMSWKSSFWVKCTHGIKHGARQRVSHDVDGFKLLPTATICTSFHLGTHGGRHTPHGGRHLWFWMSRPKGVGGHSCLSMLSVFPINRRFLFHFVFIQA